MKNLKKVLLKIKRILFFQTKKILIKIKKKNPFLVYDDEKKQHLTIKKTDGVRFLFLSSTI